MGEFNIFKTFVEEIESGTVEKVKG